MSETGTCALGCKSTRTLDDGTVARIPRQATAGNLCEHCRNRLASWLASTGIPESHALLASVATPGSVQAEPGSKSGKRTQAPIPVRLEVVDHLDGRLGWRSDGTTDRRGAYGLIESWTRLVREERNMDIPTSAGTLIGECRFLSNQLDWLCDRPWIDEFYREIRKLAKDLSMAIGEPWPRPIGHCPEVDCGEPLWMPHNNANAIVCMRCGAQWSRDRWLLLADVIEGEAS